ncbi:ferrous iron transport protein A [Boudabousia tangfeifanii]|uniref:Ferrous iron transport protein A n=1 Tax=Boudabousia tangfeifanii TaxID=1912795 RepID=A0A1D9MMX3_9ACTO|nr:ferrous iron transport protein A [Boudabousia tangfeifanii]
MDVPAQYRLRLQELGLRPGVEFTVTNRSAFGGVVLNVKGARVALDARSARQITAELTEEAK